MESSSAWMLARGLLLTGLLCGGLTQVWEGQEGVKDVAVSGPAPLATEGITDRGVYDLRAWFRVPAANGYLYQVQLDSRPVPADVTNWVEDVDYHEVAVTRTNLANGSVTNWLVRFIVQSERGSPERGLIRWTPYPPIPSTAAEFAGASLRVVVPADYPLGLEIPVIAWAEDDTGRERRANGWVTAPGFEAHRFLVRRGYGSGFLPPAATPGSLVYRPALTTLEASREIRLEAITVWQRTNGVLAGAAVWPENSRIHLTGSLTIPAGASLTIGAGTVVKLDPLVNITNSGRVLIEGTVDRPVVLTSTNRVSPQARTHAWGGFIMRGAAAELVAQGAILVGGGGAASFDFSPGASHRSEQAVLLLHSGARVALTNCYVLNTAGQVGNGYNADLSVDHCLFQRAIVGGEYVGGTVVFNHSAVLEFPADNGVVDAEVADADYDALYFTTGTHIIRDSLVGFAMDDALDSGSGGAGTMLVTNCWIESALHEGNAWSGEGRQAWTYDTVILNCGQGLECGWSTGNNSPLCHAERLLSLDNSVGLRVGDNYDWNYNGFLQVSNSVILSNYRDLFLKTWNAPGSGLQTNSWVDRRQQAELRGNLLTTADPRFPDNSVWDPATDAARLSHWMTTPPEAPVGIGLAVWTNRFALTNLWQGVPVRLSSFTTRDVWVEYAFDDGGATTLATGTLTFAPGQTLQRIYPSGFNASRQSLVRVMLTGARHGELTGITNVVFSGTAPAPQVSLAARTNLLPGPRLLEGAFARLSSPAAEPVNVDYRYEAGGITLESGTLRFPPTETLAQIIPTHPGVFGRDIVTLHLDPPANAVLAGLVSLTYSNAPVTLSLGVSLQQSLDALAAGVPVVLNGPAPLGVSVDFRLEGTSGVLTNGTLTFAPGEMAKLIRAPTVDPADHNLVRVSLGHPQRVPLAEPTWVCYVRRFSQPPPPPVVLVDPGARWRFLDTGADLGAHWTAPGFSDASWGSGPAPLGYESGEATTVGYGTNASQKFVTTYFRTYFTVTNVSNLSGLTFRLRRDDGAVVYLNGGEVYRENMPTNLITYTNTAVTNVGGTASAYSTRVFATDALSQPLREGGNVLAVEVHQSGRGSSDILLDLEVDGELRPLPPLPQPIYAGVFDGVFLLAWGEPAFELEQADEAAGPWTTVAGAASPFPATPALGHAFFRLRKPGIR